MQKRERERDEHEKRFFASQKSSANFLQTLSYELGNKDWTNNSKERKINYEKIAKKWTID